MRNFSSNSNVDFQSYTVNMGEYVKTVDVQDVVIALAAAFETDVRHVKESWNDVLLGKEYNDLIPSSEYRVLETLYEFAKFVCISIGNDGVDTKSRVFSYVNFNTGKSVIWVHFIS